MSDHATAAPARATPKRARPAPAPVPTSAAERDFIIGRDLAIELLQHGQQLGTKDDELGYSLLRWERGGDPLEAYAAAHLRRLMDQPGAIDGFAAVLGEFISGTAPIEDARLASFRVPFAEILPGVPGDDGTTPHPGWTPVEVEHFRETRARPDRAVELKTPSLAEKASVADLRIRERANDVFREVRAAMRVLGDYIINGTDAPRMAAPGVMGTIRFAETAMCGLYDAIVAHDGLVNPLWTHVYQASSLLTALEQQEFNNFDESSFSAETYSDFFSAVQHCVERGQEALGAREAA